MPWNKSFVRKWSGYSRNLLHFFLRQLPFICPYVCSQDVYCLGKKLSVMCDWIPNDSFSALTYGQNWWDDCISKSLFKRLVLVAATKIGNIGSLLLQCQQTSKQRNVCSYTVERVFYTVFRLEQSQKEFFVSFSLCSMHSFKAHWAMKLCNEHNASRV